MKSHNPAELAPFSASWDWYGGFRHCYNFQSLQLLGEAKLGVQMRKPQEEFPVEIQKLIEEGIHWIKSSILKNWMSITNANLKSYIS